MSKTLLKKMTKPFAALRADERGAESSEVILVLVILVVGMMAAWSFLKGKIMGQASRTGSCIEKASSAPSC
jgi:Flp pilus assembly pilin Flp